MTLNQLIFDEEQKEQRQKMTIAKRNDLIQKMRFNLSRNEQLCVLYAISKIKPTDTLNKEYELDVLEIQKLMMSEEEKHYAYIKKILKNVRDKSAWVKHDDGKSESVMSWFNSVTITKSTGKVKIKFDEKLQPYLVDLHRQYVEEGLCYTTYNLIMVLKMKSKYGIRLYELIKSYSNNRSWTFEIDELKEQMGAFDKNGKLELPKKWSDFSHFKTKVIEPAIADINNSSDLHIGYDVVLSGRKVVRVTFFIEYKTVEELREIISPFIPMLTANSSSAEDNINNLLYLFANSKETAFRREHPFVSKTERGSVDAVLHKIEQ